jgi:hypothetical protein
MRRVPGWRLLREPPTAGWWREESPTFGSEGAMAEAAERPVVVRIFGEGE